MKVRVKSRLFVRSVREEKVEIEAREARERREGGGCVMSVSE